MLRSVAAGWPYNLGVGCYIWLNRNSAELAVFLVALIRALSGRMGANLCSLRHVGREQCGHGLSARRLETVSVEFLSLTLNLCGYPLDSSI